ncbi:MAG TPA: thioredoxin-disulfide reductase [Anaerolineales bacterium]|nr:thioredoxin-disulfide reductase [Anaerolineales bacterium]
MNTEKLIIIGSGPAGLTAALYAARANLSPLCIEGYQPGGQLMITSEVENFPGFPNGIMGPELMMQMREQAERFGTRFITADATRVDLTQPIKQVWVDEGGTEVNYPSHTVIISTGARAKLLGLPNESRLMGRGVSACATCDGFFFRGQEIAVVGGGDSAMEEANFLTRFANKVYLIHRRDTFRASSVMLERIKNNPKIELMLNQVVEDVLGEEAVTGVRLKNTQTDALSELAVTGLFIAIGHSPNTDLFAGQLALNETGYLITERSAQCMTATQLPGVFACGDVQDDRYRQAISAAGTGCMAALDAQHYLEENNL